MKNQSDFQLLIAAWLSKRGTGSKPLSSRNFVDDINYILKRNAHLKEFGYSLSHMTIENWKNGIEPSDNTISMMKVARKHLPEVSWLKTFFTDVLALREPEEYPLSDFAASVLRREQAALARSTATA